VPPSGICARSSTETGSASPKTDEKVIKGDASFATIVLDVAAERAGLTGVGFHTLRHTCASILIESGLSPLRLQRWMGHHSAAFTLETYGHLIDGDFGPALDLRRELRQAQR
jgi:integrase